MRVLPQLLFVAAFTSPQPSEVVIRERLSPENAVRTMAGTCGTHRFGIELRHDGQRNVLSLNVDGHEVARAEVAKVVNAVRPGYFMYDPSVAECFCDRRNARHRILTDGPNSGGTPVWVSFEVSPDGQVSAVRED